MSSEPSLMENKAIFSELKAEYIYMVTPFVLLVFVKLYSSEWKEIFVTADWSLASCIIFGQITAKVSVATVGASVSIRKENFGLYVAKRFFLVVLSLALYFFMLTDPSLMLGLIQVVMFLIASFLHFSDGYATKRLYRERIK